MSYRVQRGDSLSLLAQRFGTTVTALAQANGIRNVNLIHVGQTLVIPGRSGGAQGGGGSYQIRAGDTLSAIAQRFGTTVSALARANGIANPDLIHTGHTLKIPGRSDDFAPPSPDHAGAVATSPGAFSSRANHLANVARDVASRMNSRGWCAKGFFDSLQAAGMAIPRSPSAYMAASTLAHDPRFREVHLSDAQIKNLPPGAIVVSGAYNFPGNPHGHIAISLGNGMEASDHIGPISTLGSNRVFIPV